MANANIHYHVEDHGLHGASLGHTTLFLEGGGTVPPVPSYHSNPNPVCPENLEHAGAHSVLRNNINTFVLVQGVMLLLEVHTYLVEEHLPHGRKLLYQLGIKGVGPRPAAFPILRPARNP